MMDTQTKTLKDVCLTEGEDGICQCDKNFRYKEEFIDALARNRVPAKGLGAKLKLPERTFHRHIKKKKWRTLQIGKNCFVRREDCV